MVSFSSMDRLLFTVTTFRVIIFYFLLPASFLNSAITSSDVGLALVIFKVLFGLILFLKIPLENTYMVINKSDVLSNAVKGFSFCIL